MFICWRRRFGVTVFAVTARTLTWADDGLEKGQRVGPQGAKVRYHHVARHGVRLPAHGRRASGRGWDAHSTRSSIFGCGGGAGWTHRSVRYGLEEHVCQDPRHYDGAEPHLTHRSLLVLRLFPLLVQSTVRQRPHDGAP